MVLTDAMQHSKVLIKEALTDVIDEKIDSLSCILLP